MKTVTLARLHSILKTDNEVVNINPLIYMMRNGNKASLCSFLMKITHCKFAYRNSTSKRWRTVTISNKIAFTYKVFRYV